MATDCFNKRKTEALLKKYKKDFEEFDEYVAAGWKTSAEIGKLCSLSTGGIRSRAKKLKLIPTKLRSRTTWQKHDFFSPEQIEAILNNSGGVFSHFKNRDGFVARANLKHNNFYDYSKVEFTPRRAQLNFRGERTRKPQEYNGEEIITIICPTHGDYHQRARKHIEGRGCSSCAREKTSKALWNRNGDACFLSAQDFKEFDDHIEIYSTPSDGIQRTILISKEDKDILKFTKWYITGHQPGRHSRTCYCVAKQTNRTIKEGYDWLGSGIRIHRLIMSRKHNRKLSRKELIDHDNENGLDNRRENLRFCNDSQNHANAKKLRTMNGKPCSSQYKGVYKRKGRSGWYACIGSNKSNGQPRIYLGRFDAEEEAAIAYDAKAKEYYGEFANLNFPDG